MRHGNDVADVVATVVRSDEVQTMFSKQVACWRMEKTLAMEAGGRKSARSWRWDDGQVVVVRRGGEKSDLGRESRTREFFWLVTRGRK